jgi:hypothetical protein
MATTNCEEVLPQSLDLKYEMLDGTVVTVTMWAANVPPTTSTGRKVRSGSLHFGDTEPNDRGYFTVEKEDELTIFLPKSGRFAFFFQREVSVKLLDDKGLYKSDCMAIVPDMKCFIENVGQDYQFSVLATTSEQGKELGLDHADKDNGVFTMHTRILQDAVEDEEDLFTRGIYGPTRGGGPLIRKGISAPTRSCGPTRSTKAYNVAAGFADKTNTTWTTSDRVPASKMKTIRFRIKVLQRNTKESVAFRQQFCAAAFKADPLSDDEEKDKVDATNEAKD